VAHETDRGSTSWRVKDNAATPTCRGPTRIVQLILLDSVAAYNLRYPLVTSSPGPAERTITTAAYSRHEPEPAECVESQYQYIPMPSRGNTSLQWVIKSGARITGTGAVSIRRLSFGLSLQ